MTPRRRDKAAKNVLDAREAVRQASAVSESMAIAEFPQEDGSTLVISSFQGGDPEECVFGPSERVVVPVPVLPGAIPQGIQDDGSNAYDETGPPDGLVDGD